jgi:hypothetical protein
MTTSTDRIPQNPSDNLKRMEGILARYKSQIIAKKEVYARTLERRERVWDAVVKDEQSRVDTQESKVRLTILRKYDFDLDQLEADVRQLRGKIVWAEDRQIPFLKTEVERFEDESIVQDTLGDDSSVQDTHA